MPIPGPTRCFDHELLQRFLGEQLDETDEARVQEHVGSCPECQQALEGVAAAPALWSDLREHLSGESQTELSSPATSDLDDLAAVLDPTDDPQMLGRLGGYEVCGLIGRGATGLVMKALEPRLKRYVAIKLVSPEYRSNGSARRRFEREGRAIAAVSHEHVVPIYAVDDHRGLPYIVMKYIPGPSLQHRIDQGGPLDTTEVTRVGLQVAQGLSAAHAQGIVHRDVKPANVILESTVERAMVTDFGLARVADEASMTRSGTITGTPQYMSPEQARGDAVDSRSDLFSLGSLMYAACTGRPPFRAETVFGVINRVCEMQPRQIREVNPQIDEWLAAFIDRLMSKRPEDRFQTAADVASALSSELAYLQSPIAAARPRRPWLDSEVTSSSGGRRRLIGAGVIGLSAAVGLFALSPFGESEPGNGAQSASIGRLASLQDGGAAPAVAGKTSALHSGWTLFEGENGAPSVLQQEAVHSLPIEGTGRLYVRIEGADLEVLPGAENTARLRVLRRVSTNDESLAESFAAQYPVDFTFENSELSLISELRATEGAAEEMARVQSQFIYRLELPVGFQSDVLVRSGDVFIGELGGNVRVETVAGDIYCAYVGGSLWARAEDGDIDATQGCGEVEILTIGGNVRLAGAGDGRVRASGGSVYLGENPGDIYTHCAGGTVLVTEVDGPTTVHNEGGDITVLLTETPTEHLGFSASRGDVSLFVEENVAVLIRARGDVVSSLPFAQVSTTSSGGDEWNVCQLNEGENKIRINTTTGSIFVAQTTISESAEIIEAAGDIARFAKDTAAVASGPADDADDGESDSYEMACTESESGAPGDANAEGGRPSGIRPGAGSVAGLEGCGSGGSGLGGSGLGGSGLGGSGLGGSGSQSSALSVAAHGETSGIARPGSLVTVALEDPTGNLDGYTLYLPVSHGERVGTFPLLLYLQGAYGVGGEIRDINNWGLPRLLRDEKDLSTERNRLLLDEFIVVSLHIQNGGYAEQPEVVQQILDDVLAAHKGDPERIYVTGLSRGGHGSWELPEALPGTFAAAAPAGGRANVTGFEALSRVALWVAHNENDRTVPFVSAENAIREIEAITGVDFMRTTPMDIADMDYQNARYLHTSTPNGHHDAWTDLYTSEEFYRWLLLQKRQGRTADVESVR